MGYFYAVMWVAVGLVLIFSIAKENKIFYFAGAFFLFLGGWWLADSILQENLFQGKFVNALRIVTFAALLVLSIAFFIERQKTLKKQVLEEKAAAEKAAAADPNAPEYPTAPDLMPEESLRAGVAGINLMKPRLDDEDENKEKEETEEKDET